MEQVKEQSCKHCGATSDNMPAHKDGSAAYWSKPDECSVCRKFPFTRFRGSLQGKGDVKKVPEQYFVTEDQMKQHEHDLLYGELIQRWENNTRLNRNRFIQELTKRMNS